MSTPPFLSSSLHCIKQHGLCAKCSCCRTLNNHCSFTQHVSPSKPVQWPFSASLIVSKVVICHTGPGSAACSLKLIATITKAHPLLFTVHILFKESVIYSYFTLPDTVWTSVILLYRLDPAHCVLQYLKLSSDLDLLSHSHVECAQFIGPVSTNRHAFHSIAKSVLFYVILLMVTPSCFLELLHPFSSITLFSTVFCHPLYHSPSSSLCLFLSLVSWQSHLSLQLL